MGTGEDEGVRWISMELVEGGRTLRDLLEEMRSKDELSERYYPEIAELFAKIAEARAVARAEGEANTMMVCAFNRVLTSLAVSTSPVAKSL